MFEKILISQCFLGDKVRYNGEVKSLKHPLITLWQQQQRFIAVCPEVAGGLPVPRPPAEITPKSGKVITQTGNNVTEQFNCGAQQALAICQKHQIRFALLKESSPSCGSNFIYDGSFSNKKIAGQGLTSQLLMSAGIRVFSEHFLEELASLLDKSE